jgi:serine/threonine protein kinase
MQPALSCPERDDYARLIHGDLPPSDVECLSQHLADCSSCAASVQILLGEDSLLSAIGGAPVDASTVDPVPADLTRRLLALPAQSPSEGGCVSTLSLTSFLAPAQAPDEIGRLGPYRVLKVLGSGGMGIVFQAQDVNLIRLVALKVMKPEAADKPGAKERFLREAQSAAALEHEHIVSIYQVGEERGVPYLAMQWLRGMTLEERLKHSGPRSVAEVVRLGRQIARGLAAAHAHGLIHRDVKPANIWLEELECEPGASVPRDRVKILDFGLARAVADDAHLTQSGVIVGTPAYMAPEQARSDRVDPRSDLFSLGVVLYRLCTGRLPFQGGSPMAVLSALAMDAPKSVRDLNPKVPPDLANLVMQLLAKDPARRPVSASDVARQLADLEAGSTALLPATPATLALPVQPAEPSNPWGNSDVTVDKAPDLVQLAPTKLAASSTRPRRRLLVAAVLLLALLPLAPFFGAQILRIATNRGELVLEVDDPKLEVTVKENGTVIQDRPGQREITLLAGDHEVEVTIKDAAGETHFFTKKLTLKRGGQEIVNVRQELSQTKKLTDKRPGRETKPRPQTEPQPTGSSDKDLERRVAEWILSIRGQVTIRTGDKRQDLSVDLPAADFRVVGVRLIDNKQIGEADLAKLKPLTNLEMLMLNGSQVSDSGMAHLQTLAKLRYLLLSNTLVGNAGMEKLEGLANIEHLGLDGTLVGDAGLVHLKRFSHLSHLNLSNTRISDAGLAHLVALRHLFYLELNGTPVGDSGLEQLKVLSKLGGLHLSGTQVSDAGMVHLKALTNIYTLQLGGTRVSDSGLKHLPTLRNLQYLYLDGTRVGDAGLAYLQTLTALGSLRLTNTQVSDAGLVHLKTLNRLRVLELDGTLVSDAGLEHLHGLGDLRSLNLAGTKVTAQGVLALQKTLPKCHVVFGPKRE